ncbi:MAG TPA: glycosyltransferase family 1 protein [Chthoniobacterales bacterium]
MRIGFDVSQTCGERAGCAWYADSLARALVEVAPEHEYFLYHQFGRWINETTAKGTIIQHPSVRMPLLGVSSESARDFWSRSGITEKLPGDPEIVQTNSFQVIPTAGAKLVFVIYDISFWIHPEFTTEANRLNCQYGVLEALQRADAFLFISRSAQSEFEALFPGWLERNRKPAAAIPLASRIEPGAQARPSSNRFWLAVGTMEPRKNYAALFAAIELYWARSEKPAPLWIAAAAGWKSEELKRKAQALEAEGRIRLLGYVDEEQLASLYQLADGLVFPSWYEGFGLPVLEAMRCGCPVIASDRSSLPEVGGDAVLLVDPARPESICAAMLLLEQDEAARSRRREAGLRQAGNFDWRKTARATLDFYRDVLG